MTLATHVRIPAPLSPKTVFTRCQELLGAEHAEWKHRQWWPGAYPMPVYRYQVLPGQNLPAWLSVSYCPDGPMPRDEDETPDACVEVWFNTSYSFRGAIGDCYDLHRHLVEQLGVWLDDQGVDWWAHDEDSGEWHHRSPCPVTG